MRRHLVFALFTVAACSKSETPADTTAAAPAAAAMPAPITAADLTGTWETKAMPMNSDTVVAQMDLMATGTMDGWTARIPGNANPVPVRVVTIGGDSVVTEAGPYNSITRKGQKVSIHTISHLKDGMLTGVIHATWANGDTATFRSTGTKKP